MILISPEEYFSEKLNVFFNSNNVKVNSFTKNYLISFLIKYIEINNLQYKTLFDIYKKCIEEGSFENYSTLGEQSLFISGIFPTSIKKTTLNISYFIEMGKIGYLNASNLSRSLENKKTFKDISENFNTYMNSLYGISKDSFFKDKMFLFETYLETKNPEIYQDFYIKKINNTN